MATDETLLVHLVEQVEDYAIFALDPEGHVRTWNRGAERELRQAVAVGRATDDRWHVRKDGTHFWANGITLALRDEHGNLRGFAKVLRDKRTQTL